MRARVGECMAAGVIVQEANWAYTEPQKAARYCSQSARLMPSSLSDGRGKARRSITTYSRMSHSS